MKRTTDLQHDLEQKQATLAQARETLKAEFAGLDLVIDSIFNSIGPWYMCPDMQEQPLVINLWGMTGVGKSSLVNRMVELIGYTNGHFRFDMGEVSSRSEMNIRNQLKDQSVKGNPEPFIISLDEFQHARTLDEDQREMQQAEQRIVWNILDNGKFDADLASFFDINILSDLISRLEHSAQAGVKVENGRVTKKKDVHYFHYHHHDLMEKSAEDRERLINQAANGEMLFVEEEKYALLYKCAPEMFENRYMVGATLKSMNEIQTVKFLTRCLEVYMQPTTIDCSRSLVFVIGNLDEAYTMSGEFTPELSADEFHRLSKNINITTIKKALKKRFRSEQIARLGNNHIIYPALSCSAYRQIIQMELNRLKHKVYKKQGISLYFRESVIDLIYNEGVYPTQGTKPVYSTIHQIINTRLSVIFSEITLKRLNPDVAVFNYQQGYIHISLHKDGRKLDQFEFEQELQLGSLQVNRKDNLQAITAVHESGHGVLQTILVDCLPKVIYSVLSDSDRQGMTHSDLPWDYLAQKDIIPQTAVMLGGYAAEIAVFGRENLTAGANMDIEKATDFLTQMYKKNGMGDIPINYGTSEMNESVYHQVKNVEEQIRSDIEQALDLALKTLQQEKNFLLALSDYLSDYRMITKKGIKEIFRQSATDPSGLPEKENRSFYRNLLKSQVSEEKEKQCKTSVAAFPPLNKNAGKPGTTSFHFP